jgi:LacI family transcriptional regulator
MVLYNKTSAKFSSVSADNNRMGEMAAEIFAARGHKLACVLATQGNMAYMDERVRGFQLKAEALGMTVQKIFQENSITGGYRGGHLLCAMKQQPDSIFCLSDAIAAGALRSFKEARFEIPEQAELICIGNGDKESEEYAFVSLSVIHLPLDQMAVACLNTALEILDGRISTPRAIEMPIVYHERESCGGVTNSSTMG